MLTSHECSDVIESRNLFLRKMVKLGFLHFTNAPTKEAAKLLPSDIDLSVLERRKKTVIFFHDESTFMSNDDQPYSMGIQGR